MNTLQCSDAKVTVGGVQLTAADLSGEVKVTGDDVARHKRMEDMPASERLAYMMAMMNRRQARAYKARMKHFHGKTPTGPALLKGALEQAEYCLQSVR